MKFQVIFIFDSEYQGYLAQVPQTLTPELMTWKLDLLVECLEQDFGIKNGTIAIARLNPHSRAEVPKLFGIGMGTLHPHLYHVQLNSYHICRG